MKCYAITFLDPSYNSGQNNSYSSQDKDKVIKYCNDHNLDIKKIKTINFESPLSYINNTNKI